MINNILNNFVKDGAHVFGEILDPKQANILYQKMLSDRNFGENLFLLEKDFLSEQRYLRANPDKKNNFLNQYEQELQFVETDKNLQGAINYMLGDDYEVVVKKTICGVPFSWLPQWVAKRIENVNVANLAVYIKPEYRDITYFRGIDYHQDMIDWPKGRQDLDPSTFITLYVYIHNVSDADSPLHLIPKSHKFGGTIFPHKLLNIKDNEWKYIDDDNRVMDLESMKIIGKTGYVAMWHSCTLHGTQPVKDKSDNMRLSLRYLLAKSNKNKSITGIDIVNSSVNGKLELESTRRDIDIKGEVKIKGNIINKQNEK